MSKFFEFLSVAAITLLLNNRAMGSDYDYLSMPRPALVSLRGIYPRIGLVGYVAICEYLCQEVFSYSILLLMVPTHRTVSWDRELELFLLYAFAIFALSFLGY